ncbi:MAG: EF-P 5-aminopentanol modification-associated protein YfmH [Limnochordia bacterium]|jgi:predicted Zn-dependent peptidase
MAITPLEKIHHQTLSHGLEAFVLPRKYNKLYAVIGTKYGSIDNEFVVPGHDGPTAVPAGIAHFLEHKLFDEEWGNAFERFGELGASANAYTSYALTAYLFSATDGFWESFDLLLDFVQNPYFTPESVAKEKGIIQQELMMIEDDPDHRLVSSLLKALFHKNPVRIEIGGTVESIEEITPELLYDCHKTFYHPSNMALCVVGDVDPQSIMERVEANLRSRDYGEQGEIQRIMPAEPAEIKEARVESKLLVSRPRFALGFKETGPSLKGKELLRREIATNLLLELLLGRSSDLYNSLYEQGIIDDNFSHVYYANEHFGFTLIGGETEDPARLEEQLRAGLQACKEKTIPSSDLERVRKKAIGQFVGSLNSSDRVANNILAYHFRGHSLDDYFEVLQDVALADVEERWRHLNMEAAAVSIVRPSGS